MPHLLSDPFLRLAMSCRPELVRSLFTAFDVVRGLYAIRLYKNAQWVNIFIDDYLPVDMHGEALCGKCEYFPYSVWVPLLEKAYAKLHWSWEHIGQGGHTESAMTDFTGGVSGRFWLKDVTRDRTFIYFHELQHECIWAVRPDQHMCIQNGILLPFFLPYAINRVIAYEGKCYFQLRCGAPVFEDGTLQDSVPTDLITSFPEKRGDGFFWISNEDFHLYFNTIIECRLVNTQVQLCTIPGGPPPRRGLSVTPPWNRGTPIFEQMLAFSGTITETTCPEFIIEVRHVPCEVTFDLMQIDAGADGRWSKLRVGLHTGVDGMFRPLALSNWHDTRNSNVSVEIATKCQILAVVSMDRNSYTVERLIARIYSTQRIQVTPREIARRFELSAS